MSCARNGGGSRQSGANREKFQQSSKAPFVHVTDLSSTGLSQAESATATFLTCAAPGSDLFRPFEAVDWGGLVPPGAAPDLDSHAPIFGEFAAWPASRAPAPR